jgi:Sulfotransferase domain
VLRKPDLFIVGAPRCGTTSMHYYLKEHPEIFMSQVKEPHFFGTDLVSQRFLRHKDKYLSLFSAAENRKRVGESSIYYLYSKIAAVEIRQFCPTARIIIMLRNPADMIYSLHGEHLFCGDENIFDFEKALMAEETRRGGLLLPVNCKIKFALLYREIAKYDQQVERYLKVFGREQVKVIIFDDFKKDTARAYKETCEFLDVNADFRANFRTINAHKVVHNRVLMHFWRNPPKLARWLGNLMPRLERERLVDALRRRSFCVAPLPSMNQEMRQQLQQQFLPSVERLSQLIGRDLTHWCREGELSGDRVCRVVHGDPECWEEHAGVEPRRAG